MQFSKQWVFVISGILLFGCLPWSVQAEELNARDAKMLKLAQECRTEVIKTFDSLVSRGKLKAIDLQDTFYIPIPNTTPQKFTTRYDKKLATALQPVIDKYLRADRRLIFTIVVDANGYAPLHNTRFSRPLTGDMELDAKRNRAKRIFSDRTGLAAARNTAPYLLQQYNRDTGESMIDLSVPIDYQGRHWGAVRFGYQN